MKKNSLYVLTFFTAALVTACGNVNKGQATAENNEVVSEITNEQNGEQNEAIGTNAEMTDEPTKEAEGTAEVKGSTSSGADDGTRRQPR
jgi:hypothetical protein